MAKKEQMAKEQFIILKTNRSGVQRLLGSTMVETSEKIVEVEKTDRSKNQPRRVQKAIIVYMITLFLSIRQDFLFKIFTSWFFYDTIYYIKRKGEISIGK